MGGLAGSRCLAGRCSEIDMSSILWFQCVGAGKGMQSRTGKMKRL